MASGSFVSELARRFSEQDTYVRHGGTPDREFWERRRTDVGRYFRPWRAAISWEDLPIRMPVWLKGNTQQKLKGGKALRNGMTSGTTLLHGGSRLPAHILGFRTEWVSREWRSGY